MRNNCRGKRILSLSPDENCFERNWRKLLIELRKGLFSVMKLIWWRTEISFGDRTEFILCSHFQFSLCWLSTWKQLFLHQNKNVSFTSWKVIKLLLDKWVFLSDCHAKVHLGSFNSLPQWCGATQFFARSLGAFDHAFQANAHGMRACCADTELCLLSLAFGLS